MNAVIPWVFPTLAGIYLVGLSALVEIERRRRVRSYENILNEVRELRDERWANIARVGISDQKTDDRDGAFFLSHIGNVSPDGPIWDIIPASGKPQERHDKNVERVDREWYHAGFDCMTMRGVELPHPFEPGTHNGYVAIPVWHQLHGAHIFDPRIEGLDTNRFISYAGEILPDGRWWIGFHTAHYGDNPDNANHEIVIRDTEELAERIAELNPRPEPDSGDTQ